MRFAYTLSIIALIIGLTLTGCGSNQVNKVSTQPENLKTVSFMIKGYTWEHCTKTVGSAVKKLDGIEEFDSKVTGETTVTFDSSKVSFEKIKKVIIKLGYEVSE